jgi:hypothetical protein
MTKVIYRKSGVTTSVGSAKSSVQAEPLTPRSDNEIATLRSQASLRFPLTANADRRSGTDRRSEDRGTPDRRQHACASSGHTGYIGWGTRSRAFWRHSNT